LECSKEQGWIPLQPQEKWEVPQSLPGQSKAYHRRGNREKHPIYNRHPILEYSADLNHASSPVKHYLQEVKAFWTDPSYEGIRPIPKVIEQSTFKGRMHRLSFLLGWLILDKVTYHHQMCERAHLRKAKDPNFESDWLSVDPTPPAWLQDMQEMYPPRTLNEVCLEEMVPVVEIRPNKLQAESKISVQNDVNTKPDLLSKIQAELEQQGANLSFDTIIQLNQALSQDSSHIQEIKQLNQITARALEKERADEKMELACRKVRQLIKSFFKWLQYQHNPTDNPDGYRISPNYR
jgi:hypothetical protein